MTGPPTPPPSSATEIQDAARSSVPPTLVASNPTAANIADASAEQADEGQQVPQSEQLPSHYEQIFEDLASLAAAGNYQELVKLGERGDLYAIQDSDKMRLLVVAPLVLSYMILDQLPPARFALTRLPDNIQSLPVSQALFGLLASTIERKYASVYSRARELVNLAQPTGPLDARFAEVVATMTTAFVDAFRKRTFALLSKAYTSISLSDACTYLGLDAEQVVQAATTYGWSYSAETQVLSPAEGPPPRFSTRSLAPSSLDTFNAVADGVAALEAQ